MKRGKVLRYLIVCSCFVFGSARAVGEFRTPLYFPRLCWGGCGLGVSCAPPPAPCPPPQPGHHHVHHGKHHDFLEYIPPPPPPPPVPNYFLCCRAKPWAIGYCRFAHEAFVCDDDDCPCCVKGCSELTRVLKSNKSCENKTRKSLAALWFGKEDFRAEEAFFGGKINPEDMGPCFNPFLNFSRMSPRFEYLEKGVIIGMDFPCKFGCDCIQIGARISLPYKFIKVSVTSFTEEDLKDVVRDCAFEEFTCANAPSICPPDPADGDYAYRLDFLRSITTYSSPGSLNPTQIGGINVGAGTAAGAPIYTTKRSDGSPPHLVQVTGANPGTLAFGKVPGQVSDVLAVDGSGIDDDSYFFGPAGTDYAGNLGADCDAQRTLWVVPQLMVGGGGTVSLVPDAKLVKQQVTQLIESALGKCLPSEFLCRDCRISLKCSEKVTGIGDLAVQLYTGYVGEMCCWFSIFGVTFPTGQEVDDPRRVYLVPTGNNGHFEIKWGMDANIMLGPIALGIDASFNQVLTACEKRAAPFCGATVRNIGPPIVVDVRWDYWMLRADLNFYHACCAGFGGLFGYELFSKGRDCISLSECRPIAEVCDCLGRSRPIDLSILEEDTDRTAHKIRGELFHISHYGRAFFGASYVFSGKNVMNEIEVHLGIMASF